MVAKFFNTAGPVNRPNHYKLDPLQRIDCDEIESLIVQEKYFVLHAPRQTGKTSCLLALRDHLNGKGEYRCVYCNVEAAQAAREDVTEAVGTICEEIISRYGDLFDDLTVDFDKLRSINGTKRLSYLLKLISALDHEKPFILFIDEIDSLIGDTLISVLRQIRAGYDSRPALFPQSIILCGVRDVRDYRMHSKNKEVITGGSAFNIKARSLELGNFSRDELCTLYLEHTRETGQVFADECFDLAWAYTQGQPWLVNALAYEVTHEIRGNRDRSVEITADMFQRAKENLIYRRETHLDQLSDKLKEERVRNVIAPLLESGDTLPEGIPTDDIQYVMDLGLIVKRGGIRIANDIYREVIPRELTWVTQDTISIDRLWFVNENGSLNMPALLEGFQKFFRKHSEHWVETFEYKEAGPQLLLQAFLQRVVNGGGIIEREYGLGHKRTDLYVKMPYDGGVQEVVLELKIQYNSREHTIKKALIQTREYMDKCSTKEGYILIFDRSKDRSWEDKIFSDQLTYADQGITIWGM